jgi:hypothetical protein
MANENVLELEKFEANSFAGISSTSPVIIDFTAKRKNQNVVEFLGDQGTGKSSTLMGILYAMGATFNIDKKKLLNSIDSAIDETLSFKYEGESYQVIAKTARIELKKLNENGKWSAVDSPVAMLRKMFGPVGLSPFSVKEMKGKDQIKYFQDMFGSGEDASKKIKKLEDDIEVLFSQRRDVNRDAKALSSALELEPLFQNYEKSQERFKKPVSADKEKKAFEEISKKNADYEKNKAALENLSEEWGEKTEEIVELRQKLDKAIKEEAALKERVENGKKWEKDNAGIPKEFEAAQKEWLNLAQVLADYEKWREILAKEKTLIETQELAVNATAQLDDLREKLLKLTKSCLPKVEGLEIKVAAGLDKTDKPEGVFFNDQAIHELSESEFTDMWCQIWDAAGVNFIFIENTTSMGSGAVATMNRIAKNGGIIFGTHMERSTKDMSVVFKAKLD